MEIFITGATGVLGKRVSKILLENHHHVIGLARSEQNISILEESGIEPRKGDLFNKQQIFNITRDCDAILHLATHIPQKHIPKKSDWYLNDRIRTEGTINLMNAALNNKIKVFIQESVTFIYGDQQGKPVTEDTPLCAKHSSMLDSAIEMEKTIKEKLTDKIPYIILRFGTFYSKDSFHTRDLLYSIKKGKLPMINGENPYWNFIHADDAASAVVFALDHFRKLQNQIINVTDYTPVYFNEFIEFIRKKTNSKKPPRIPSWIAKLILGKDVYSFLTNSYQISDKNKLAGWTPKYSDFQMGLKEILSQ